MSNLQTLSQWEECVLVWVIGWLARTHKGPRPLMGGLTNAIYEGNTVLSWRDVQHMVMISTSFLARDEAIYHDFDINSSYI